MVMSRSGILWLVDFEEDASLRLSASHVTNRAVNDVRTLLINILKIL